jgi:flagellar biosynthesis protein FliR
MPVELYVTFGRWDIFLLVLARVASVVSVAPLFGSKSIPTQVKVGLAVTLTVLLAPMQPALGSASSGLIPLAIAVAGEVLIGLLMGFAGAVVFSGIQIASRLIGVQIGLGMPSTMDPLWSESGTFLDTYYSMLALVVFLTIGGHHLVIAALARSFELLPVGTYGLTPAAANHLIALSGAAFNTALHIGIAAVATMLLTDLSMGLVMRTMPQMNIFAVGIPVKIVIGLIVLSALMPWTVLGMADVGRNVTQAMAAMLP